MNPEFRRLTAADFQGHRLAALAVVLAGAFGAAYLADDWSIGATTGFFAVVGFFALVFVWGTRQAAESVIQEINLRTWDAQRMSSLPAWSLAWSKLTGATAFTWLGGFVCLAFYGAAHIEPWGIHQTLVRVFLYAASGFFAQAVCFLIGLAAIQRRRQFGRVQVVSYQFLGLLVALPPLYIGLSVTGGESILDLIIWYGRYVTLAEFMTVAVGAFSLWALVGAWALMRAELQEPIGPWVWAGFTLFAMAFFAGVRNFPVGPSLRLAMIEMPDLPTLAFGVGLFAAYSILYTEPKDRLRLFGMVGDLRAGRWQGAARLFPRSLIALALALLGGIFATLADGGHTAQQVPALLAQFVAMTLFALRDFGLTYWICLGRTDGRGEGLAAAILVLAYIPVPMALGLGGVGPLLSVFTPVPGAPPWLMMALPGIEAAGLIWLLRRRWRRLAGALAERDP